MKLTSLTLKARSLGYKLEEMNLVKRFPDSMLNRATFRVGSDVIR